MKLHYYPETDSLYIELLEKPGVKTLEIRAGLNADLDDHGQVVGFDIDHLSEFVANNPRNESPPWGQPARLSASSEQSGAMRIINPYTYAFENAVLTPGVRRQLRALSDFQIPDAPPVRSVSLTLDDPAPLIGAERDAVANL